MDQASAATKSISGFIRNDEGQIICEIRSIPSVAALSEGRIEDGLQYILFHPEGLKIIAQKYHEKYQIKIDVISTSATNSNLKEVGKILREMRNGEVRGVLEAMYDISGNLYHVAPFVFAKNEKGKIIVVNFNSGSLVASMEHDDIEFDEKTVENYLPLQSDFVSCSVIATDEVKNLLMDPLAIKKIFTPGVKMPPVKEVIGQGGKFIAKLDDDKTAKYVREGEAGSKINHKAFFKGIFYLSQIGEHYLNWLNDQTKALFFEMRETRMAIKEDDALFEDVEDLLPDGSPSKVSNASSKKFLKPVLPAGSVSVQSS